MESEASWIKFTLLTFSSAAIAVLGAYQLYQYKKNQRIKTGVSKEEYVRELVDDLRRDFLIEALKRQKGEGAKPVRVRASGDFEKLQSLLRKISGSASHSATSK